MTKIIFLIIPLRQLFFFPSDQYLGVLVSPVNVLHAVAYRCRVYLGGIGLDLPSPSSLSLPLPLPSPSSPLPLSLPLKNVPNSSSSSVAVGAASKTVGVIGAADADGDGIYVIGAGHVGADSHAKASASGTSSTNNDNNDINSNEDNNNNKCNNRGTGSGDNIGRVGSNHMSTSGNTTNNSSSAAIIDAAPNNKQMHTISTLTNGAVASSLQVDYGSMIPEQHHTIITRTQSVVLGKRGREEVETLDISGNSFNDICNINDDSSPYNLFDPDIITIENNANRRKKHQIRKNDVVQSIPQNQNEINKIQSDLFSTPKIEMRSSGRVGLKAEEHFRKRGSMSPLQRCCDILCMVWPLSLVLSVSESAVGGGGKGIEEENGGGGEERGRAGSGMGSGVDGGGKGVGAGGDKQAVRKSVATPYTKDTKNAPPPRTPSTSSSLPLIRRFQVSDGWWWCNAVLDPELQELVGKVTDECVVL